MILNSRRTFLKATFLGSAVMVTSGSELFARGSSLDTIALVQKDLFPDSIDVPTTKEMNSASYLSLILQHSRVSESDKTFIQNGIKWLNEEAVEIYKKRYTELLKNERQNVLKSISKQRWGENWIHTMLTYIFESILSDPIYGSNKKGAGWKWLEHIAGEPRPKEALL